jgi:hypothetical protein
MQFCYKFCNAFLSFIMADIYSPQIYKETIKQQSNSYVKQRSQGEVGQDSSANRAGHLASAQPQTTKKTARSAHLLTKPVRSEISLSQEMKTEPLTIHCEPGVKKRLAARAAGATEKKLATLSGMGNALLKRGMSFDPDKPYGPSLEPVVEGAIHKGFSRRDNRLAPLQARDTRDSAQAVHLLVQVTALLLEILRTVRREPIDPNAFDRIIAASEKHGRDALTTRDPYLLELVREFFFLEQRTEETV